MHTRASPEVTMSASRGQHFGEDGGVQQDPLDLQNSIHNAFAGITCANNATATHPAGCCETHLQQLPRAAPLLFFISFSKQLCIHLAEVGQR